MTVDGQPRTLTITTPSEREVQFERVFNAPRDVVWRAFTDPSLISQWWGGGVEVEHMDVRAGGTWKFLGGHGPSGKYVFQGEYLEVDPPSRIVQTFENGWMGGMVWKETLEFEDVGGRQTRFTQTSLFDTVEQRDTVLPTVEQGANFTYGRLEQLLDTLKGDK